MTKGDITKRLNALSKAGAKVYTLNSHRAMPTGSKGLPDHQIFWHGRIFYCEVKIGRDKSNVEQQEFEREARNAMHYNPRVVYLQITEKTIDADINFIINFANHK